MDESGSPGVAMNNNDFLLVSLVIFSSKIQRQNAIGEIENLIQRMNLPKEYEFHCSSNGLKVQRAFIKLLARLEFKFITVSIRKDYRRETANYDRLASILTSSISTLCPNIKIEMDSNPELYKSMRKYKRSHNLSELSIRQRESKHNRLIQIADYVVNLSARKIKNKPNSTKLYKNLREKEIVFVNK